MKIYFENAIFENGRILKSFDNGCENLDIKEQNIFIDNRYIQGSIKDIQLNNMYILSQNYNIKQKETLTTHLKNAIYQLHINYEDNIPNELGPIIEHPEIVYKGSYCLTYLKSNSILKREINKHQKTIDFYFNVDFFNSNFPILLNNKQTPVTKKFNRIVYDIITCTEIHKQKALNSKILELFQIILDNSNNKGNEHFIPEEEVLNLNKVKTYLDLNFKKNTTITMLAALAGCNTSKLKRNFKLLYGSTIFKYITSLRVQKAKELILDKNYTVAQASYEVGYKNPQHFTVAFKKKLGYLPSLLKQKTL